MKLISRLPRAAFGVYVGLGVVGAEGGTTFATDKGAKASDSETFDSPRLINMGDTSDRVHPVPGLSLISQSHKFVCFLLILR